MSSTTMTASCGEHRPDVSDRAPLRFGTVIAVVEEDLHALRQLVGGDVEERLRVQRDVPHHQTHHFFNRLITPIFRDDDATGCSAHFGCHSPSAQVLAQDQRESVARQSGLLSSDITGGGQVAVRQLRDGDGGG